RDPGRLLGRCRRGVRSAVRWFDKRGRSAELPERASVPDLGEFRERLPCRRAAGRTEEDRLMPSHITVNGLGLTYKGTIGLSIATIPDVCKTPRPGGPIPLPYP